VVAAAYFTGNVQAEYNGKSYRGTVRGKIYQSADGGKTWQLAAKLGESLPVQELFAHQGQLFARVGFEALHFYLKSNDGRTWYTAQYVPPAGANS
jgi:photosystem II stability/assembly factor-like uncharacterized protein